MQKNAWMHHPPLHIYLYTLQLQTSVLAQFADYLSPGVRAITVDDDGLLIGVSTDPE
jgi:hypothetical protein